MCVEGGVEEERERERNKEAGQTDEETGYLQTGRQTVRNSKIFFLYAAKIKKKNVHQFQF